jgi:type III secretion protein R
MAPVGMEAMHRAHLPGETAAGAQVMPLLDAGREPFRAFLKAHATDREKAFFLRSARQIWPPGRAAELKEDDLIVLAPAFILSELTAAFKIGFLLYLSFIVIDLVVANVLMALGLSQVSPTNVAIPFKLLLFVSLDGWSMLVHGLISTYK